MSTSLYPELPTTSDEIPKKLAAMATLGSSTFRSRIKEDKPVTIKLDNIKQLTGQENYIIWESTMRLVWKGMKTYEIVVEGQQPSDDAEQDEVTVYTALGHQASAIYIQVVSTKILEKLVEFDHPHEMWNYLRTQYYRDTAFALVSQIPNLATLSTTYDPGLPITVFIAQFETDWLRLSKLAKASKDSYRQTFARFLGEDKAKRDCLLGFLVGYQKNIVDNLSTKDDFTFAEVKQRLLDLDLGQPGTKTQQALVTTDHRKPKRSPRPVPLPSSAEKLKDCTWCSKHHPGRSHGHMWNKCFKLKAHNEKKGNKPGYGEEAHTVSEPRGKVSRSSFYFDTCATSHMCPNPERFEHLTICSALVKSSSTDEMKVTGKGSVVLRCPLREGTVSCFRLTDVLLVPQLDRPLVSWPKLQYKGFQMIGTGPVISVKNSEKTVFEAIFDGLLPRIPEVQETAMLTFEFWHEALEHLPVALSSIERTRNDFADTGLIPPVPQNFHCMACAVAKSTHKIQSSTKSESLTTQKAELIHSDLCGPFPIPSYGNSLYYVSFVCDATRFCWVRFLGKKSEAAQAISDFVRELETQEKAIVRRFCTDNGREYINDRLRKFFASKGITHELTPPYSPESNDVAELLNRTIGEGVRAMMHPMEDRRLWAEAVGTFGYTKNRQPHSALSGRTPYEAFYKAKLTISHLQPLGRKCYRHIPKAKRGPGSKLLPRAQNGLFVGYTNVSHQYRVFIPKEKRTTVSADVPFPPHLVVAALENQCGLWNSIDSETHSKSSFVRNREELNNGWPREARESYSKPPTVNLEYRANQDGFPTDTMWIAWMDHHPETANRWYDEGHPKVVELFLRENALGKRDGFLGSPYWLPDDSRVAAPSIRSPAPASAPASHHGSAVSSTVSLSTTPTIDISMRDAPLNLTEASLVSQPHLSTQGSDRELSVEAHPDIRSVPVQSSHPASVMPMAQGANRPISFVRPEDIMDTANDSHHEWRSLPPIESDTDDEVLVTQETSSIVNVLDVPEPETYIHAQQSPNWNDWQMAIEEEIDSLESNKVWEIVDRLSNRRIIDGRWVFRVKGNAKGQLERFKARYVAKGFSQVQGVDYEEIFAPVARFDSLRLLLAIAAAKM